MDVGWAGDWSEAPGDLAIIERARVEQRVLVTLDKDFGELAVVRLVPHAGIVPLVGLSAREQMRACLRVVENYGQELAAGGLVTVEPGRVRVRSGELWTPGPTCAQKLANPVVVGRR